MDENQNIEWKQSWQDDYLKWVCGFANAQGGIIYIGKDDDGKTVGAPNYRKLLEDIPNKIRDFLGVVCDVNLLQESRLNFIEIKVPPYSVPISFKGRYYYRSGSTKLELTGNALSEFLLKKTGKSWDEVIEDLAIMDDIDDNAIRIFLADAVKSGRIPEVDGLSKEEILDKLRLSEAGRLKRAAIILFGKDPNRFYSSIRVKIGKFGIDDTDLQYQEVIEGNIIFLLKEVIFQLDQKFLVKKIEFEGIQRLEKWGYPMPAIREMLLNALVHRIYGGSTIQIRVFDHKISIWNEGLLPVGLDLEALKRQHASRPRNLLIADICFKAGYIDLWGRGTLKIIQACKQAGLPDPKIEELDGGIQFILFNQEEIIVEDWWKVAGLNERQKRALEFVSKNRYITNKDYQELNNVGKTTATEELTQMLEKGIFAAPLAKGRGARYQFK